MTPRQQAAQRATEARIVRQCCGNDGGLWSWKSSPHVLWLAERLEQRA